MGSCVSKDPPIHFNHFLNKNTYIVIYIKKLRGKVKNRNKFPNKWPPKPQKKSKNKYNK